MHRLAKLMIGFSLFVIVFWIGASALVAYLVIMPKPRDFQDVQELAGRPVESVSFPAADGKMVSGWYVPMETDRAMVFTHGIGGDRRHQTDNIDFYLQRGFAALTIDLRGHGKSEPGPISMGLHERHDFLGAVAFLRERGYRHIGADGISLGAATIIYAFQDAPELDFVILESSYDTIDNALNNRVAMVGAPTWVAWSFRHFASLFLGAGPDELRPLDWMDDITAPTLVLAGDSEDEIPVHETQGLFAACGAEIKEMFLFPGGKHPYRLVRKYPDEYARVVDQFLGRVFGGDTALAAAASVTQ